MAEAQLDDTTSRPGTPTPTLHFTEDPRLPLEQPRSEFSGSGLRDFAETYDSTILATPTIKSENPDRNPDNSGGGTHRRSESMDADSRKGKPESSKSDHTRPPYHRRRSRSTAHQQRPNTHPPQPSPSPGYVNTSSSTSDNTRNHPPTDFRAASLSFPPAAATYPQGPGFIGQYTMPSPPVPMNMSHSPSPYAFSHNFHHSVVPDSGMMSQNIHANYPPIVQPLPSVFSYQGQPPENIASSHPSFSGSRNPLYLPHQSHESSASPTSHQSSTSAPITPNFVGSSPFHSLQYPSSMSIPTYRYPPSPMYQSQYPSPNFGQHYTPSAEAEQQVAWYYFSHLASGPSPQQYDPGPSYQGGQYTIGYSHSGQTGVDDTPFRDSPRHHSNPNQAGPSASHTMDLSPSFGHYAEDQLSSDSPSQSGSGLPHHQHSQVDGTTVTAAPALSRVSAGSSRQAANERPVQRRSYHPNPPSNRSEWVMWAGNVPSGATHDELWRFFTAPPDNQSSDNTNGVLSIFLISRSSCAFVNYHSEEDLQRAIARFDGVALRSTDPRCPRLVCRVRGQGDDLKAGVGYQRGSGMHTKWLRDQKGKTRETQTDSSEVSTSDDHLSSPGSVSKRLTHTMSTVSISSEDDNKPLHPTHSSSSGSYASTTSSFLVKYYPKRYFILKSLSQDDLDLSVERCVWATQKHNEEILDQAFRTSQEVYLIFGVNKSREFYGYARMRTPVRGGQQNIKWAARSVPVQSSHSGPQTPFFSPGDGHLVEDSPLPYTPLRTGKTPGPSHLRHSAPALLGEEYHKSKLESPKKNLSLDQRRFNGDPSTGDGFELDASAPVRAMRIKQGLPEGQESSGLSRAPAALHAVAEEGPEVLGSVYNLSRPVIQQPEEVPRAEVSWGDSFEVEWISTTRFPFAQTRHLRNPWNRDKEIKVSRDGTELEPSIGARLLGEWPQSTT